MEIEERLPEGATEELNLVQTGQMIVWSALQREESRGGHFRIDFPRPRKEQARVEI
jgi:L-aspartate oxidase